MVTYGSVPQHERRKDQNPGIQRKYFYASAIAALGFLGAVVVITQGINVSSKPTYLSQKTGNDASWVNIVNSFLPDRKGPKPAMKAHTNKLDLTVDDSAEKKPAAQGKLDSLGVGVDSWPWEKQNPSPAEAAAARVSLTKDDLVNDIMLNFRDTVHNNPMSKKRRTSSLEAELIGKSDDKLPPRAGRLPIDTCSEDTPNCNKLRLQTGIKVYGWPWDKAPENASAAEEPEAGEEAAAERARPASLASKSTMLRGKPTKHFRRAGRVARGMALLEQRLAQDARSMFKLSKGGVSAAVEEKAAQALQKDSFLMSAASAAQMSRSQALAGAFGLDPKGIACHRGLGGCNATTDADNATNASTGWQIIPGWYWLPKTAGGGGIESKGINVDSWGGVFGAVRWQRHASQQLKADAADMSWLADSDAASPNLRRRVSLMSADRHAWEARLAKQLSKYAAGIASLQKAWCSVGASKSPFQCSSANLSLELLLLDSVDGCKCVGSSDEDRGPRCSCEGQPDITSADEDFSPSEVTSW